MELNRLSKNSMDYIFSILPQNIQKNNLTNDAFHFVYAIAKLEGAKNGKELYDAFWNYNKMFTYGHKDPITYAIKYRDIPFILNAGKTFSITMNYKKYILLQTMNKKKKQSVYLIRNYSNGNIKRPV